MGRVIRQRGKVGDNIKVALGAHRMKTQVGWFAGNNYGDGTPVAYVATIQEFGSPSNGIPPRSFMRTTVIEKSSEWAALAASGARAALAGNATAYDIMDGLGIAASGDVRKKIATLQSPPIQDSTIKARQRKLADGKTVGSLTKPLIETAIMMNTCTSVVIGK